MGLARTGSVSGNGSGDLFLAFSTANAAGATRSDVQTVKMLRNSRSDSLSTAAVQATEEAIVNALVAAEDDDRCQRPPRRGDSHDRFDRSDAQVRPLTFASTEIETYCSDYVFVVQSKSGSFPDAGQFLERVQPFTPDSRG